MKTFMKEFKLKEPFQRQDIKKNESLGTVERAFIFTSCIMILIICSKK